MARLVDLQSSMHYHCAMASPSTQGRTREEPFQELSVKLQIESLCFVDVNEWQLYMLLTVMTVTDQEMNIMHYAPKSKKKK